MATWQNLKSYIAAHYTVNSDEGDTVTLTLRTKEGRTQTVTVLHTVSGAEIDFATIASPVGTVAEVDLDRLLGLLDSHIVGGAATLGGHVVIRHAVPLESLDVDEFEVPLHLVARTADQLEKQLLGHDKL